MPMGAIPSDVFKETKTLVSSTMNKRLKENMEENTGYQAFLKHCCHIEPMTINDKNAKGKYILQYPILGLAPDPTGLSNTVPHDFVEAEVYHEMTPEPKSVLLKFNEREIKNNQFVIDRVSSAIDSVVLALEDRIIDMIINGHTSNSSNFNGHTWVSSTDYYFADDHTWNNSSANDNKLTYSVSSTLPTVDEILTGFRSACAALLKMTNDQGRPFRRKLNQIVICCCPELKWLMQEAFYATTHYIADHAQDNVYSKENPPIIWADSRFTDSSNNASFYVFMEDRNPAIIVPEVDKPYERTWLNEPDESVMVKAADWRDCVYGEFRSAVRVYDSGA